MNDLEPRKEIVPTKTLAKRGVAAVSEIVGGVLLLLMHTLSVQLPPLGIVLGLITGGIGVCALLSKDPEDKKPGAILTVAGVLKLVFHLGIPIAGTLLKISSLGLLVLGIVNGIRFLRGLKSRS